MRVAYPGSFDPLTVAHLGIAEAASAALDGARVDLVISRVALGKEHRAHERLEERVAAIGRAAASRPWLAVVVTDHQLVADIAEGYDAVVVGADKWAQLHDPAFYDSDEHRAAALARLPRPLVVPRPPWPTPDEHRLDVPPHLAEVSASEARRSRPDWIAPEAGAGEGG